MSYLIPLDPKKYFSIMEESNGTESFVVKDEITKWCEKNSLEVIISVITPELKKVFSKKIDKFKCDTYDDEDIDDGVFIEMTDRRQYSMFKLRWEV